MKKIKIWWQALRFHFTFPTFLPVILGNAVAILETKHWNWISGIAMIAATVIHHIGLNLADDYYDYQHGTDVLKNLGKNPYAGGSGILVLGLLKPKAIYLASLACYLITILIGLFIVYTHGLWALILGIFGVFCSYYYTAPPLRLAYRGLGELAIWINFGPVLILGSYYLQAHSISIAAILLSIIMGNLIFSVIIANEIPDYTNDKLAGKNTLIVKFGKQFGIFALMIAIIIIFGIIIFTTIIIHVLPMIFISTLLIIPISIKAITILKRTMHLKKIHGNEFIIQFANLFGIILILGTIVMLLIEHLYIESLIIFIILGFFCYLTMLSVSKLISK